MTEWNFENIRPIGWQGLKKEKDEFSGVGMNEENLNQLLKVCCRIVATGWAGDRSVSELREILENIGVEPINDLEVMG